VNRIEVAQRGPLQRIQEALGTFAENGNATSLAPSERTLRVLQARLAKANPPPAALRLHRLVIRLVAQELALVRELEAQARFAPRFRGVLQPLTDANGAAQTRLHRTKTSAEVVAAIADYRVALVRALTGLRAIHPPPVEQAVYDAQVARLRKLVPALDRLSDAVQKGDVTAVQRAEHAIAVAWVSTDSLAAQRANQKAVRAFDARVARLVATERAIAVERSRLQRNLK
jgi:hypothetical protein